MIWGAYQAAYKHISWTKIQKEKGKLDALQYANEKNHPQNVLVIPCTLYYIIHCRNILKLRGPYGSWYGGYKLEGCSGSKWLTTQLPQSLHPLFKKIPSPTSVTLKFRTYTCIHYDQLRINFTLPTMTPTRHTNYNRNILKYVESIPTNSKIQMWFWSTNWISNSCIAW